MVNAGSWISQTFVDLELVAALCQKSKPMASFSRPNHVICQPLVVSASADTAEVAVVCFCVRRPAPRTAFSDRNILLLSAAAQWVKLQQT
jgi:hypothetical protein